MQKVLKTILKGSYSSKEERKEIQNDFNRNEVNNLEPTAQFAYQKGDCNWGG